MGAIIPFQSKSVLLCLVPILLILCGCAPRVAPQLTPLIPETGATPEEPRVETSTAEPPEPTPPFTLEAVRFEANLFKNGTTETLVEQDKTVAILPGDRIEVSKSDQQREQSYSILNFADFLKVELFTDAGVVLKDITEEDNSTHVILNLSRGHLFVHLNEQAGGRVTVETTDITIESLDDGTEFNVCKTPNEFTCVEIKKGSVEIAARGKKQIVKAGEASIIFEGDPPSPVICAPAEIFLDWEVRYQQDATAPSLGAMINGLQEPCGWQTLELPPNARKVYEDQFTDPASGWLQQKLGNYLIGYSTPEYYHIQVESPGEIAIVSMPNRKKYDDFNVDLKANLGIAKSGDFAYGLVFRRLEDQYYAFAVSPSTKKWYVIKSSSSGERILRESTDDGIQGMEDQDVLRVAAKGPIFTFYINSQLVYQFYDDNYVNGEVGLYVRTIDSPKALVYFDSILVWERMVVANATQWIPEICLNQLDDDGDRFIDKDDADCNRLEVPPTDVPPTRPPTNVPPTNPPTDQPPTDIPPTHVPPTPEPPTAYP